MSYMSGQRNRLKNIREIPHLLFSLVTQNDLFFSMRGTAKKFFGGEFSCRHREITDFFYFREETRCFLLGGVNLE